MSICCTHLWIIVREKTNVMDFCFLLTLFHLHTFYAWRYDITLFLSPRLALTFFLDLFMLPSPVYVDEKIHHMVLLISVIVCIIILAAIIVFCYFR